MDWSLDFLTPSDYMAQATEALTTTVTAAVTSSISLNGAPPSGVISLEAEDVIPPQLCQPVKISASASHPVETNSPEWRKTQDGKLIRPLEANERYYNAKGDDAWPLSFSVKLDLGELDEVLFMERIRQVWGQIAIENPHATSTVQDSMYVCEVLDSEEKVQKWVRDTVIVNNEYKSAREFHYNYDKISGTKLFFLTKPRQLVLCSPHSRLDAHGAFRILHTLLSKTVDIPTSNIIPGIPAPSIEQALGVKNTTMAHEQQAKVVLMEVKESLPSLWLRPDLNVHSAPQKTEHSCIELTEAETQHIVGTLHRASEVDDTRHYTVTALLYTAVIAALKQQDEMKSLKYFSGPCMFDLRPSVADKANAETLFGMMATQWPVVIRCESRPPNHHQPTLSNSSSIGNGMKLSSISNGSLSAAPRAVSSASSSPISATFNLGGGRSSPLNQSSPVSATFNVPKKTHLRSVASYSTLSTIQSSANFVSPEEVMYLQRILDNVVRSLELPKKILHDNVQDGIVNPIGSIKPMAHAASTVLKQLMTSEVVHPTPVISSVGDCERYVRQRYGSSIKVKDIWIGLDCTTPKVNIMAWTFAGKLHIELKYNTAYYTRTYVDKFLADVRRYMFNTLEGF